MLDGGERTCTCGVDEVNNAPTDIGDVANGPSSPYCHSTSATLAMIGSLLNMFGGY